MLQQTMRNSLLSRPCPFQVLVGRTARISCCHAPTCATLRRCGSAKYHGASFPGFRALSRLQRQHKSTGCRKVTRMSFLGVGAPEAILVGAVALIVFGPKGLAEAAKGIGAALRSFQPTIREVVQVSQELRSTVEQELGLDELRQAARPLPLRELSDEMPQTLRSVSDEMAKAVDPDIEAKRAAAAEAAWGATPAAATPQPPARKELNSLSMEELEAELARRRAAGPPQEKQPSA